MPNVNNIMENFNIDTKERKITLFLILAGIFSILYVLKANPLIYYFLYMSITNTILPLPSEPAAIAAGAVFGPLLAGLLGGAANCVGATVDYYIGSVLPKGKAEKVVKPILEKFKKHAFLIIIIAGFTPFIFDPFRLAAGYVRYNITKYWLAVFIGRSARFYLLAWLGFDAWKIITGRI